eukprot:6176768-Pleurochrysis_carterae.AAC.1
MNDHEQEPQMTTDRGDAHLLVSVFEAPSPMEDTDHLTFPTSGGEAPVVTSSSGQVAAHDSDPSGLWDLLPTWKSDRKDKYVIVDTAEGTNPGRDNIIIYNKDDTKGVSAVTTPSGTGMAGAPDEPPSRDARQLLQRSGEGFRVHRPSGNSAWISLSESNKGQPMRAAELGTRRTTQTGCQLRPHFQ